MMRPLTIIPEDEVLACIAFFEEAVQEPVGENLIPRTASFTLAFKRRRVTTALVHAVMSMSYDGYDADALARTARTLADKGLVTMETLEEDIPNPLGKVQRIKVNRLQVTSAGHAALSTMPDYQPKPQWNLVKAPLASIKSIVSG